MDPRTAAPTSPDPDAVEFVRFCYRRRRVGWPELYDEMCAVANRGLFRGYGSDDLAARGVAFGLFDMPRMAALAASVVDEEKAARRATQVMLRETDAPVAEVPLVQAPEASPAARADVDPSARSIPAPAPARTDRPSPAPAFVRLAVPAGA